MKAYIDVKCSNCGHENHIETNMYNPDGQRIYIESTEFTCDSCKTENNVYFNLEVEVEEA